MTRQASDPSEYDEIIIESNDGSRRLDLRLGVQSIDYYEDVFSPTITAKMVVTTTGNVIDNKGIYQGLPLRGGERVSLRVLSNAGNPNLDFSKKNNYLYVSSITNIISSSEKESFVLNLCSREAITNETARVVKKFPTSSPISASAETIIKEHLQTSKEVKVDQTQNKYGFIGNTRKPFTVLRWLASKGVPEGKDGSAGYFFFETSEGYNFRSIDKLISQTPKTTKEKPYFYSEVVDGDGADENFKIISYVTNRNENMLEKLRLGAFASIRSYFDPFTFRITNPEKSLFKIDDYQDSMSNLGRKLGYPKISEDSEKTLGEVPTRIFTGILDRGTIEKGVSVETNSDQLLYQSQSLTRYNTLFTQTLTITVGANTNLHAGDVIRCEFPKTTTSDEREMDSEQSGLYMIKELCHHYDTEGSYTSAKLIRDTFGQFAANNKEK
tara:strand:- start:3420 stop:4739 length:1320 start_codon:yes stop_codon:yes gene_type:complete